MQGGKFPSEDTVIVEKRHHLSSKPTEFRVCPKDCICSVTEYCFMKNNIDRMADEIIAAANRKRESLLEDLLAAANTKKQELHHLKILSVAQAPDNSSGMLNENSKQSLNGQPYNDRMSAHINHSILSPSNPDPLPQQLSTAPLSNIPVMHYDMLLDFNFRDYIFRDINDYCVVGRNDAVTIINETCKMQTNDKIMVAWDVLVDLTPEKHRGSSTSEGWDERRGSRQIENINSTVKLIEQQRWHQHASNGDGEVKASRIPAAADISRFNVYILELPAEPDSINWYSSRYYCRRLISEVDELAQDKAGHTHSHRPADSDDDSTSSLAASISVSTDASWGHSRENSGVSSDVKHAQQVGGGHNRNYYVQRSQLTLIDCIEEHPRSSHVNHSGTMYLHRYKYTIRVDDLVYQYHAARQRMKRSPGEGSARNEVAPFCGPSTCSSQHCFIVLQPVDTHYRMGRHSQPIVGLPHDIGLSVSELSRSTNSGVSSIRGMSKHQGSVPSESSQHSGDGERNQASASTASHSNSMIVELTFPHAAAHQGHTHYHHPIVVAGSVNGPSTEGIIGHGVIYYLGTIYIASFLGTANHVSGIAGNDILNSNSSVETAFSSSSYSDVNSGSAHVLEALHTIHLPKAEDHSDSIMPAATARKPPASSGGPLPSQASSSLRFINPHGAGAVVVTMSSTDEEHYHTTSEANVVNALVSPEAASLSSAALPQTVFSGMSAAARASGPIDSIVNCTADRTGSWICVDLGMDKSLLITGYSLKHDNQVGQYLRHWELQGKINTDTADGGDATGGGSSSSSSHGLRTQESTGWVTLRRHDNDVSLCSRNGIASWPIIHHNDVPYRYFRVVQHGSNSSRNNHKLHCAGIEFYGTLMISK